MLVFLGTGGAAVQLFLTPLIETGAIIAQNQADRHTECVQEPSFIFSLTCLE
ncbi:hypothetical protein KSC_101630 [Ktedonobacter sp. SOSP1-52]|nr:hypothetical protein KSC_101630 [Ktedonobacter sp. SOSP1-52]